MQNLELGRSIRLKEVKKRSRPYSLKGRVYHSIGAAGGLGLPELTMMTKRA